MTKRGCQLLCDPIHTGSPSDQIPVPHALWLDPTPALMSDPGRAWRRTEGMARTEASASRGVRPHSAAVPAPAMPSSAKRSSAPCMLPLRSKRRRRHSWYLARRSRARCYTALCMELVTSQVARVSIASRRQRARSHHKSAESSAVNRPLHGLACLSDRGAEDRPQALGRADLLARIQQQLPQVDEVRVLLFTITAHVSTPICRTASASPHDTDPLVGKQSLQGLSITYISR